jgi:hypothetical protein
MDATFKVFIAIAIVSLTAFQVSLFAILVDGGVVSDSMAAEFVLPFELMVSLAVGVVFYALADFVVGASVSMYGPHRWAYGITAALTYGLFVVGMLPGPQTQLGPEEVSTARTFTMLLGLVVVAPFIEGIVDDPVKRRLTSAGSQIQEVFA